ncbi:mannose-1-phosphate guanylyltransferase [Tenacibaculum sp. 190524A05c]|uniref:mannose-1-phosphate guanylyltransferase n=1 Tax=Tenacibaculum platacis TaxID=3137852 RepID=UPI0031FAC3F2
MERKIYNVILSGGSGTRLWPLSRENRPKQFLKMFDGFSLFQHTLKRNEDLVHDYLLITNSSQINLAENQAIELKKSVSKKIIEPVGRNTAPAIALAAFSLNQEDIMLVTPSDHMTGDKELYNKSISRAIELAEKDFLVTFGIKPFDPNTGFGYIEHDNEDVLSFREKPDLETAKYFLEKGGFSWNSGMFCFKASSFLKELELHNKDMYQKVKDAYEAINQKGEIPERLMSLIPSDSIDYAVLEKSNNIKVISSEFYWTDLGTFDAIVDYFNQDEIVNNLDKNYNNNYLFSPSKKLFTNKKGLIVIDTDDAVVILEKGNTNEIKEIYNHIKSKIPELK